MLTKETPIIRAFPALSFKFADGGAGKVEGYASTFGGEPDSYGHVIAPGAFTRTLAEAKASGQMPPFLWAHDPARPIGQWVEMEQDAVGLKVIGQLTMSSQWGAEAFQHLSAGDTSGLSIGWRPGENGYRIEGNGTVTLLDIELWEISAVTLPANRRARVTGVKTLGSQRELESLLRDELRLPKAAAKKLASGGWPALANSDQHDLKTIADLLRKSAAQIKGN